VLAWYDGAVFNYFLSYRENHFIREWVQQERAQQSLRH
jgi:hypothetical protein